MTLFPVLSIIAATLAVFCLGYGFGASREVDLLGNEQRPVDRPWTCPRCGTVWAFWIPKCQEQHAPWRVR